ncbi:MAG: purine-binding chemotaxis protein CheW [Acidobacteria bacterium]|nr:purine-binding chemotaxis protein CheW [Acidobacteriota bacterium]
MTAASEHVTKASGKGPPPLAPGGQRGGKYLVFHLGEEEFGVHVLKVREIMGLQEITAVPHAPAYVRGVINLRGKVVPVIDLRRKFLLPEVEYSHRTCIVVVQVVLQRNAGADSLLMGVIVDGVSEVLNVQDSEVEDKPSFGGGEDTPYILGMAKVKGKVKILLDIDEALAGDGAREFRRVMGRETA